MSKTSFKVGEARFKGDAWGKSFVHRMLCVWNVLTGVVIKANTMMVYERL